MPSKREQINLLVLEHTLKMAPVTSKNGDKIVVPARQRRPAKVWTNAVVDARYSLSVPEQRLILWLAAQIEKEDDALEDQTVGVLEMQELAGRDSGGSSSRPCGR